jgi:hypothetical protein
MLLAGTGSGLFAARSAAGQDSLHSPDTFTWAARRERPYACIALQQRRIPRFAVTSTRPQLGCAAARGGLARGRAQV